MRDQDSFDQFYAARASRLVRLIYTRTGDWQRSEECVQEAFIRAWQRWRVLDHDDPYRWVMSVAWRLAVRDWHKKRRETTAWAESHDTTARSSEHLGELRDLVQQLPTAQADVLLLHYLEDLAVRDVAIVLRIPEGTVKSHLSRGRKSLAKVLTEDARR